VIRNNNLNCIRILKCAFFVSKEEMIKQDLMSASERLPYLFSRYSKNQIIIQSITFLYDRFRSTFFLTAFVANIFFRKKFSFHSLCGSVIIVDHSSRKFKNKFSLGKKLEKCEIKFNIWKVAPLDLIYLAKIGLLILGKHNNHCPEMIARFLSSVLLFDGYLSDSPYNGTVVNDDLMPEHLSLLCAMAINNKKTSIFRINHALGRIHPPIDYDLIFLQNQRQSKESARASYKTFIANKFTPISVSGLFRLNTIKIGVILPSKVDILNIVRLLSGISCPQNVRFLLKPHPSYFSKRSNYFDDFVKVESKYSISISRVEDIDGFSLEVDVALAGNTSAVMDLLNNGVPVLYTSAIDSAPYDAHRWLRDFSVYELKEPLEIDIDKIYNYYVNYTHRKVDYNASCGNIISIDEALNVMTSA
jgi:hypothetical protein